jgi:hypothetical protein
MKSTEPVYTQRNSEKTYSKKYFVYPENNYGMSARICLSVENVSESMWNIFNMSCNIGMPTSLYETAALSRKCDN